MRAKQWMILAILLALCLCVPAMAESDLSWSESFSYDSIQEMLDTDLWALEGSDLPMGIGGQTPSLENGCLVLETRESVELCWPAIPQIGDFDPNVFYTLSFDLQLLDWENNSGWINSRELYVGAGGWYNFLELKNGNVSAANSGIWEAFDPEEKLHVDIFWQGTGVTTTVYGENGSTVCIRSRSRTEFLDMEALSHTMERWVFRCEDGSVALSNLSFSKTIPVLQETVFSLNGETSCSGVITVTNNGTAVLSFDGGELLRFSRGTLTVGGLVEGSFPAGTYPVSIDLNFQQKNALVSITLPDGRVIRRGDSQLLGNAQQATALVFAGTKGCSFADLKTTPPSRDVREYALPQQPADTSFDSLAWNLTSAFNSDGKTTRCFAWTAHPSMAQMAVRYAEASCFADPESRIVVDANRESPAEPTNQQYLYYKADLTGLFPGTQYTYQIGDKSTDQWGEPYTFTTEKANTEDFSFLVLSDTQSWNWDGYRYAAAALEYGLELAPDARFLLHGGDVVEQGYNETMWTDFFRAVKGTVEHLPLFSAIGNHDTWAETSEKPMGDLLFDLHFNHPDNGGLLTDTGTFTGTAMNNLLANLKETFYSFDYGNVHVVVLNSGTFVLTAEDNRLLELQRDWLAEDLASSDAQWTVALVHQGVYHRSNPNWYCNALQDLLEDAGVDLVLHGHEHLVKRTYPIRDGEIVVTQDPDVIPKGAGTVYATVGSTVTSHDHLMNTIEECLLVNGLDAGQAACTVVRASREALSVEIRTLNGLIVDAFTISDRQTGTLKVEIDEADAQLSTLLSGREALLKLQLQKSGTCTVAAALYKENGQMAACVPVFTGSVPGGEEIRVEFRLPVQSESIERVRFFLWEEDTLRPLCEPWQSSR